MVRSPDLKRPFLGEAEAGQGHAVGRFRDFHFYDGRIGGGDFGGAQDCVLRKHFAVDLGDEVVLASCVLTPDLSEFDVFHGH
jgi:hypothetical protein